MPVAIEQFVDNLTNSGLISANGLSAFQNSLPRRKPVIQAKRPNQTWSFQ